MWQGDVLWHFDIWSTNTHYRITIYFFFFFFCLCLFVLELLAVFLGCSTFHFFFLLLVIFFYISAFRSNSRSRIYTHQSINAIFSPSNSPFKKPAFQNLYNDQLGLYCIVFVYACILCCVYAVIIWPFCGFRVPTEFDKIDADVLWAMCLIFSS